MILQMEKRHMTVGNSISKIKIQQLESGVSKKTLPLRLK